MSGIRLTPLAVADLEEIYSQIAQHRPTTAFKIADGIEVHRVLDGARDVDTELR
jgi:plasmid stabilization system protein ParE